MKEREKEREADARDRQREKEELEEIRRKLMDEGHPDPEAELAKVSVILQCHFYLLLTVCLHVIKKSIKNIRILVGML